MTLHSRSLPVTRYAFLASVCALFLLGQGCLGSKPAAGLDGGVYRTHDNGVQWKQLKILNLGSKLGSIADLGTVSMAVDPEDPLAVYVGTTENGLIYSLDGGESWMPAKGLSIGRVNAIAIDPKDKCTVYAASANQIFKTTNCSRDWNRAFFDPRTDKVFTALAIDWFNSNILYAGTSEGDLFRSDDGGSSWRVSQRVDGVRINTISIDPRDSRMVYVATNGSGVLKTKDGGATWERIVQQLQDYDSARRPSRVVLDPKVAGVVYNVSKYGLLRSDDAGATWKPLTLPTPAGSVDIKAFVIHPKDSRLLIYATDTSIVFSIDGGATWTPKKLPTTRGVSSLIYDSSADPSLYLGVAPQKK
jgi:photosystem II stability/assembly factor-like uncharacterized protein